jgi:2-ketocyclohexanecarboxyl-CoA hydrolase
VEGTPLPDVTIETREGVRWLRLNRPERRNAYDAGMLETLLEGIATAPRDAILVITGSGGSFCAGGFLADLANPDEDDLRKMFHGSLRLFDALRNHPGAVIAAVNGAAVGGGNELVVACDLAIAAESAFLGQTGPRVGSAPVLGGTNMLAISIGDKRAKEISMLCRRYTAREAYEMGWINAVVPDDELEDEVMRWAHELHQLSPRYLEIAKISSNVWWNHCRESYLSGLGMLVQAIGSDDMLEGAKAFMEKRKPRFPRVAEVPPPEDEPGR